jgi:para-aminobenzoate synthetase/4-amino-4-deoxychorismate lyase
VRPGGDAAFNVAIRTIIVDDEKGEAVFGVGGGITYDSTPEGEYDECLLKARFLDSRPPDFRLFESLLLEDGEGFLFERHIRRARSSAAYFGFRWSEEDVLAALNQIRENHRRGRWKVRLFVARDGSVKTEAHRLETKNRETRKVKLAREPVDSSDPFLYHKTTSRAALDKALSLRGEADDVIMWNERGEITESCSANVVIETGSGRWTPPREAGLLAGTFRDELISSGQMRERTIYKEELIEAGSFFLINSVRKWIHATLVD